LINVKHILLLARSYRDAAEFARQKGVHSASWTYFGGPRTLVGQHGVPVVIVNGCQARRDIANLIEFAISLDFSVVRGADIEVAT